MYATLAQRSKWKAYWLTLAYYTFFLALLCSAVTTVYIVIEFDVPPPATMMMVGARP